MMRRELTGRHVLAITLSAFGVIIAVNLLMAVLAVGSFPGLEVPNSYVASQSFDRERAAQEALGWTVAASHDGDDLLLTIRDAQGLPAAIHDLAATIGRPTHTRDDQRLDFAAEGGSFRAPVALGPGVWHLHLVAQATDGTEFRQRLPIEAGQGSR